MKKYRIVQNNVILHECLDKEEAIETLNILSNIEPDLVIEEYDLLEELVLVVIQTYINPYK